MRATQCNVCACSAMGRPETTTNATDGIVKRVAERGLSKEAALLRRPLWTARLTTPSVGDFMPNSADVSRIRAKFCQTRAKFGIRVKVGRVRAIIGGRSRAGSGENFQNLGQDRSTPAPIWPLPSCSGRCCPKFGHVWPEFGRVRPASAPFRPSPPRRRPTLGEFDRFGADVGKKSPELQEATLRRVLHKKGSTPTTCIHVDEGK